MKNKEIFLIICQAILISYFMLCWADDDEEIFTDYCHPDLCKYAKNSTHTGCKDGVRHNGEFQIPPCKQGANSIINLTDAMKEEIIEIHNYQRNYVACGGLSKSVNLKPACRMGALKWDKELEATAYLHATYCTMSHDKCRNTLKYPLSGQNLGFLTGGKLLKNLSVYTTLHMMGWYLEYKLTWPEVVYDYFSKPDHPMIGHFLTSLNQYNSRIGCVLCNIFEFTQQKQCVMLTCNYPVTNIKKSTTYTPCKVPASECESGTDPKYKYLCSTDEVYKWIKPSKSKPYDGDDSDTFDDCGAPPEDQYIVDTGNIAAADASFKPDKPGSSKPAPSKPDSSKPDAGKPDAGKPDTGKPDAGKPDAVKPGPSKPVPVKPGVDEECETTKRPRPTKDWPSPPDKPSDSIMYDYTEEEYDPPYSSSPSTFKKSFFQNIFRNAFILAIILIKFFGI